MPKHGNALFRDIEVLAKLNVPYTRDSQEFKSVRSLSTSPRLVPAYQRILKQIDVEPLNSIPWFGWLTALSRKLMEALDHFKDVAGVTQLSAVRISISKIIACVVLPNLPCDLPYPSALKIKYQINDKQKFGCMDLVVRVLLVMLENDHTRAGVLRHYGELLCALLFLNSASAGRPDAVTARSFYQQAVTSLLDDVHQPTVFTQLMILHTTKGDGGKISRISRKILDNKLQKDGGVDSLLRATVLSDQAPTSTQDILKISNLLAGKRPDTFYHTVLPQVVELLKKPEIKCHQVAATCISILQERDPARCESYIIAPIVAPLEIPCDEGDIEITLKCLKNWVDAAPPDVSLARPLPLLCFLHTSLHNTLSALKSTVTSVLLACFSKLSLPCPFAVSLIFPPNPGVYFAQTTNCSVVSLESEEHLDYEMISQIMLEFTTKNNFIKAKVDIYRSLLRYVVDPATPLDRKIVSTDILSNLSSDKAVLDSLCEQPQYLIDFLTDLFMNDRFFDDDSVSLGLVLLTVFLNDKLIHRKSNWIIITKLEKPLANLTRSSVFEIKSLASEIMYRLSDLGIIKDETSKVPSAYGNRDRGIVVDCDYEEAYKELMDPHLPIRAHAMRTLAKLLQVKHKKTMSNKSTLLSLFKANLDDNDSYLYLSAVEGLSSLAAVYPDDVLMTLCKEFVSKKGKPELRLKIGQILVKTTNIMGDVGAVYKNELMKALLVGVKDSDPLVRASSLSNIGEVAKVLAFRIHDYIVEVLHCVECIVDSDREMEPRRAAVMLVGLLIQGLGNNTLTVLDDLMPTLYRKLRMVYQSDRDEVTRLHAQTALDHLTHAMRSIIFTKPTFSKRISILDLYHM